MEGNKAQVITHNATFHTDDIFAVAVLSMVLGENNISVIRTRDPKVITTGDYVVDVGGEYDPSKNRFDHHQDLGGFSRPNGIPYASFGLVWKKFGPQLSGNDQISEKIDKILVQPIDALDNAVDIVQPIHEGVYPYDIGKYFDAFVPDWKEGMDNIDDIFMDMVVLARNVLLREIKKAQSRLEAEGLVQKIYENTADKRIVVLDQVYPSKEFLAKFPEPLFVIFPVAIDKWYMKPIRDNINNFTNRKNVPQAWMGKRDREFEEVSGVPGAIFCHKTGYVIIANSREGILRLADMAVNA